MNESVLSANTAQATTAGPVLSTNPGGVADRQQPQATVLPATTPAPWNLAEVVALLAVAAVSIAAFCWSAIALHGVAVAAGIDNRLAWGGPVIVDGPIIQSAFALVALNRRERMNVTIPKKTRLFFWWELALAELVSLIGNGVHAWMSKDLALPNLAAAAVAGAAPIAALAVTHALTELMEVPRPDLTAAPAPAMPVNTTVAVDNTAVAPANASVAVDNTAVVTEPEPVQEDNTAAPAESNTTAPESNEETTAERDARLVAMKDSGMSYRQIADEVGLDAGYICRIVKRAKAAADPDEKEATTLTLVS